ncbi:uncharacterized protein [Linepithema humile]|uniref:uncharacterized protein n=1 Tax=Linepithema humile TaxID=83485 RepID=UPI00351DF9EE
MEIEQEDDPYNNSLDTINNYELLVDDLKEEASGKIKSKKGTKRSFPSGKVTSSSQTAKKNNIIPGSRVETGIIPSVPTPNDQTSSQVNCNNINNKPIEENKYTRKDKGPFRVLVSLKISDSKNTPRPPLDIEVSRALFKMGLNFSTILKQSRYKWIISFSSYSLANDAVKNTYLIKSKYTASIPWYFTNRKVVIKGIPTDIPNDEIWTELKTSNPQLSFDKEDIYRLKSRSVVNGQTEFIPSPTVKLSLRSMTVLPSVFMWRTRLEMAPYIPNIRQCFNCGQLSHASKFCKNSTKCLTCGKEPHPNQACSSKPNCINCGGEHRALSSECPETTLKKRVTKLMAIENIDFNSAKKKWYFRINGHLKQSRDFILIHYQICLVTSSLPWRWAK